MSTLNPDGTVTISSELYKRFLLNMRHLALLVRHDGNDMIVIDAEFTEVPNESH